LKKNIKSMVLEENLCVGCGVCFAVCPTQAISINADDYKGYKVTIDEGKCKECQLCLSSCPSYNLSMYPKFERDAKYFCYLGAFKNTYLGYSTNKKLRYSASSGGIATELLIFALKKGIIDGAIVTTMHRDSPLRTEVRLAKTEKEILSAKGSKYNVAPVGIKIKELLKERGRFAVIGLPCHILAFKNAAKSIKELDEKIVLYIGLFGGRVVYPECTKFLLKKEGIPYEEVESISYRGCGWPGGMKIKLEWGKEIFLPLDYYWKTYFTSYLFTPYRCLLCNDVSAELADISLGDAWLPNLKKRDSLGVSKIITRTELGEKLLQDTFQQNRIYIEKVSPEVVVQASKGGMGVVFKKADLKARIHIAGKFKFIRNNYKLLRDLTKLAPYESNIFAYLGGILAFYNSSLSDNKPFIRFLSKMPKPILRTYGLVISVLNRLGGILIRI